MLPLHLRQFLLSNVELEIYIPNAKEVQKAYSNNKDAAYWSRVWPASVGLCLFLQEQPHHIEGKNIVELAAGLGLPGLYAAGIARQVTITDTEQQAVSCIRQSIAHLQLRNARTIVLNWKDAVQEPLPDVLLLSDANYDPAVFTELLNVLEYFLQNNVMVLISTPQRLAAKQFINELLPYITQQWNSEVMLDGSATGVSVFVLE